MLTGPASHRYISQRLRLHYVDWGNPAAPPLLLVHGSRDHCRSWDWTARGLAQEWHVIAPDLRGHGDSDWSPDGTYSMSAFVYDLAQLLHQLELHPVTIVGHSLGGSVSLRYTGLYPEAVRKLVAIEGLGLPPEKQAKQEKIPMVQQMRTWIEERRQLAGRQPKRYTSLAEAYRRMKSANSYLSDEQARHLTNHGINQNEDGTYSWKFDNCLRILPPVDLEPEVVKELWGSITCPTRLIYGKDSWASNPAEDGRLDYFRNAEVSLYENAGHWPHHDQLEQFVAELRGFL